MPLQTNNFFACWKVLLAASLKGQAIALQASKRNTKAADEPQSKRGGGLGGLLSGAKQVRPYVAPLAPGHPPLIPMLLPLKPSWKYGLWGALLMCLDRLRELCDGLHLQNLANSVETPLRAYV